MARWTRRQPANLTIYQNLYNVGISIIGLADLQAPPTNNTSVSPSITAAETIAAFGPGALFAVEGPNEPGNFPLIWNGVNSNTSWSAVAGFQSAYYAVVHADPNLVGVPVWTPTNVYQELDNYGLQYLTVPAGPPSGVLSAAGTVFADAMSMHVYPMYGLRRKALTQSKEMPLLNN